MKRSIYSIIALFFAGTWLCHAQVDKHLGIRMHQIPGSAATPLDAVKRKTGFMITFSERLKPEKTEPLLQSAAEVHAFSAKQSEEVTRNGVWIVVPPAADSTDQEKKVILEIRKAFKNGTIPLFVCEADKLPDGWARSD
jgi:hypothetical protein